MPGYCLQSLELGPDKYKGLERCGPDLEEACPGPLRMDGVFMRIQVFTLVHEKYFPAEQK